MTADEFCINLRQQSGFLPDDATGDFSAGIAGGLCQKIVRHGVDDDGSSQNLINGEAFVIKRGPCIAPVGKKGKEIAGMVRMGLTVRIIMISGVGKIIGAVPVFMDMHGVKGGSRPAAPIRKPENFRFHKYAVIRGIIKFYKAADLCRLSVSCDPGNRVGFVGMQDMEKGQAGCEGIHGITVLLFFLKYAAAW